MTPRLFSGDHDHLMAMIGVDFFQQGLHKIWEGIEAESAGPYFGETGQTKILPQHAKTENHHMTVKRELGLYVGWSDITYTDRVFAAQKKVGIRVWAARRHLAHEQLKDAEKGADVRRQKYEPPLGAQHPVAL